MKKILSAITAMSVAMTTMLTTLPAGAAEKITADEVKEMIYSTGLKSFPELWDKIITADTEEDVLKPETRTVKDVIDVNKSYRTFFITNSSGKYLIDYDDVVTLGFTGLDESGRHVAINVNTKNFILDDLSDTVHYAVEGDNVEFLSSLREDYNRIAEIINTSDISDVKEIKCVSYGRTIFFSALYIIDSKNNEYVISASNYNDNHAANLGNEGKSIAEGDVMDFVEWCSYIDEFNDSFENDKSTRPKYEEIKGDEIRDTDTRAPYIGTESEFFDVSGDLVSYVNELYDLGIINGYDASDVNINHMNTTAENSLDGKKLFLPEENITRAEAAAMLTRMLRYEGKYSGGFNDVSADDWFANDVAALMDTGLVNGYSDTEFAPYANIKYQEVMKILVCALGYVTIDDMVFDDFYPSRTNQKAMEIGLTDGLKSFDTTAPITRGDMAIMLSSALDTHLLTEVRAIKPDGKVVGGVLNEDITLIDYLNGKNLNGRLTELQFN